MSQRVTRSAELALQREQRIPFTFAMRRIKEWGPPGPFKSRWLTDLLIGSVIVSGRRTTRRPSMGNAFNSIENPEPSLCGNAAPILVHFFWVLPLLSCGGAALVYNASIERDARLQGWPNDSYAPRSSAN